MPPPHRQLLELISLADRYIDDRGMRLIPKVRSPSPKRPPAPAGASFGHSIVAPLGISVKMKTSLPKYTAEQISEIIDRMTILRMRWLRQVENQLASQQSRPILDDYRLSGEPAE